MKAMLIDVTKCTGCERCVQACRQSHDLELEIPARKRSGDGLSSRRLSTVLSLPGRRFVKKQCVHCLEPGCVGACPVGAIRKTKEGPVVYDPGKCMGCRYCMIACPLDIPRYEWEKKLPYMKKCDMCFAQIQRGKIPACVEACPHNVCHWGDRGALVNLAKRRIAKTPGKYDNHVYGERELGGTSVLYISDTSLKPFGWPEKVGNSAMSSYTWPLISKTPLVAGVVGGLLVGTYAIIKRRMHLQAERIRNENADDAAEQIIDTTTNGAEN